MYSPNYPKDQSCLERLDKWVVYKPAKQKGNQTKTVTVSANTDPENTILKISANVNELVNKDTLITFTVIIL